jgi:hypothetical protein
MNKRQLWIFKEGRSGSTWFCNALAQKINRKAFHFEHYYGLEYSDDGVETFKSKVSDMKDPSLMYATHYLHLLEYSDLLDPDSIFIRTTRRNKADHCMSKLAWRMFPSMPKHRYVNETNADTEVKHKPVVILKQDVKKVMEFLKKHDDYWTTYSKKFDNFVVAYEDLNEGVTIPQLDINIKFSDNTISLKKLPYEKSEVFANYDQIVDWCEQYTKELGFMEI